MRRQVVSVMLLGMVCGLPFQATAALYSGSGLVVEQMSDGLLLAGAGIRNASLTASNWMVEGITTRGTWYDTHTLADVRGESDPVHPGPLYAFATDDSPNEGISFLANSLWRQARPPARPGRTDRTYDAELDLDLKPPLMRESLQLDGAPAYDDFYSVSGRAGQIDLRMFHNTGYLAAGPLVAIHYDTDLRGMLAPDSTKMTIPAPGAVLLGGLGVVLIGRLRRRRSL